MKQISFKLLIAAFTLIAGVTAAIRFSNNTPQPKPDLTVYPINFCELIENPKSFDGKLVRVTAIHGGLGIDTPTFLDAAGCQGQVRAICKMDGDSCGQMYTQLRSIGGIKSPGLPQVDVVGRFRVDAEVPQMLGNGNERVNLFEITELKGIEIVKGNSGL